MITQVVKPFDSDEHKMKAAESTELAAAEDFSMTKARFMINDILEEQAKPANDNFYLMAAMAAYRPTGPALPGSTTSDTDSKEVVKEEDLGKWTKSYFTSRSTHLLYLSKTKQIHLFLKHYPFFCLCFKRNTT